MFLCIISCLTGVVFNMVTPILPRYALSLGATATIAGVLSSLFSITALVGRPISGAMADRLNKRHMMALGVGMMGLSSLGMALTDNMSLLMALRMVQGAGFCLNGTVAISAAVAFMPKERVAEGIGYFSLLNIVSTSVGPTLALNLGNTIGYPPVFLIIGILAVSTALLIFFVKLEEEPKSISASKKPWSIRDLFAIELLPFAFFAGAFSFSNGMISNYLSLAADAKGIAGYTLYFTINSMALVFVRIFLGKMSDKKGLAPVLLPAYLGTAAALLLIGGASGVWMIYLAAIFKALGQGMGQPAVQAVCVKKMGPEKRGLATSMYYLGADFFQGIGPIVGGAVIDHTGYPAAFYLAASMIAVAFVAFILYSRTGNRKSDPIIFAPKA